MTRLLTLFIATTLLATTLAEQATAPRYKWGPTSLADVPFHGQRGSYVEYKISSSNSNGKVFCHGKGFKRQSSGGPCFLQYVPLGPASGNNEDNSSSIRVVWDTEAARPAIECWSFANEAIVEWSYTTGVSEVTCLGKVDEEKALEYNKLGVFNESA